MEAWDADQTEANNRISFSLSGSGANNFMVRGSVLGSGQAAGRLSLPSDVSLDYETQASFSLIVSAENVDAQGHETTAEVLVAVEDVNDMPPTLDSASLQGIRVAENGSQHGILGNVVAQDRDTMSQVEVQLVNVICTKAGVDVGSLCHGWFSVLANGSVFINQSKAVDYEACDLVTLVVRAYDLTTDPRFQAYSDNGEAAWPAGLSRLQHRGCGEELEFVRSGFNPGSSPDELCPWESHNPALSLSCPIGQVELGSRLPVKST